MASLFHPPADSHLALTDTYFYPCFGGQPQVRLKGPRVKSRLTQSIPQTLELTSSCPLEYSRCSSSLQDTLHGLSGRLTRRGEAARAALAIVP